jgi:hypothetical protein
VATRRSARDGKTGRPPRGNFKGKSETFTTRITPATRAALDEGARAAKVSLSQHVEHLLGQAIRDRVRLRADIRAMSELFGRLVEQIEQVTGRTWRDDVFTKAALLHGLEILVDNYGARGDIEVPSMVEELAARAFNRPHRGGILNSRNIADYLRTPEGIGGMEAGGLISMVEMWNDREIPKDSFLVENYRDLQRSTAIRADRRTKAEVVSSAFNIGDGTQKDDSQRSQKPKPRPSINKTPVNKGD